MWEYTDKVKDHFLKPRNVGEIENPDGIAEVGSIACGDMLKITFKLDENKRITDAKFKTFGCASAIAAASALTEIIKGMTVEEAEHVTNQAIAEKVQMPPGYLISWGGQFELQQQANKRLALVTKRST